MASSHNHFLLIYLGDGDPWSPIFLDHILVLVNQIAHGLYIGGIASKFQAAKVPGFLNG